MGRKPTQYPEGISVHGSRIIIRFCWNKQRIRRSLSIPVTDKNIKRAADIRSEIIVRIRYNNFTHDDLKTYFPEEVPEAQIFPENFFGNYAQRWLDAVEVSANSRDAYKSLLNHYWMPKFATRPLNSITYSELRAAVSTVQWSSNKTRNNALIPLRGIFEMAFTDELIDRDPAVKLRNMKHQKPPVEPFSRDDAETIICYLYETYPGDLAVYAAYFEFAFFTGMRSSEMLALRWSDIGISEGYARISKAQSKGRLNEQTKVAKIRDVLLNERALKALAVMRPLTETAGSCVFRSARYGADFETEKPFRYIFNKALRKLGLRHRKAYNTRHTYATMLLMAGVNINWVASQLGNSPLMVATVYAKWINGEADITEMAKLNTRAARDTDAGTRDKTCDENTEKNAVIRAEKDEAISVGENEIGSKLAQKNFRSAQIIEFKRKGWSGRQDLTWLAPNLVLISVMMSDRPGKCLLTDTLKNLRLAE